jgi:hypothetical protein
MRRERMKLILDRASREARVFDLLSDPGEQRDLSAIRPDRAEELLVRLEAELRRIEEHGGLQPDSVEIDQELKRRLESLGYLEQPTPSTKPSGSE